MVSQEQVIEPMSEPVPFVVNWVRFVFGSKALVLGLIFLWMFCVYFSDRLTRDNLLPLVGMHLGIGALTGFMVWMCWAVGQRAKAAWHGYIVAVIIGVLWAFGAFFWFDKPLWRRENLLLFCNVMNLLFWFSAETKNWFKN